MDRLECVLLVWLIEDCTTLWTVLKGYTYKWWMCCLKDMSDPNDNDDNDNILFDHNVQIEITIFKSLENQIINLSGDYY